MLSLYQNITQFLMVQNAIGTILDKLGMEINSHSACLISDSNSSNHEVHLSHFPAVRGDCHTWDNKVFINQMQQGVSIGCSFGKEHECYPMQDAIDHPAEPFSRTFTSTKYRKSCEFRFVIASQPTVVQQWFRARWKCTITSSIEIYLQSRTELLKHPPCFPVYCCQGVCSRNRLSGMAYNILHWIVLMSPNRTSKKKLEAMCRLDLTYVQAHPDIGIMSESCALLFLDNFHEIHDWVEQKYEKKILVVIDAKKVLTYASVINLLRHTTVINDIPLTLLLQPNIKNEWIYVRSAYPAYPYSSYFRNYNRFFLSNFSFQYDKEMIPKLTDLNGLTMTVAMINYPPYTSYSHVLPGTGNAQLYNSNASLPLYLDGQENIILLEFCKKYNCTLTARLDYDDVFWGKTFHNHTGNGLLGALAMRDANVSVAAMYLWDTPYEFIQYSTVIQRATAIKIVPKPLPLPYWETPILPFHTKIWGYIVSSSLFGAVTLFFVNVCQTRISEDHRRDRHRLYGLFDSIYVVYKMSVFQFVKINIHFYSNMTIFAAILIYSMVIGYLYSGGLASVMTMTRYEAPINTLEDLIKSKYIWGATSTIWLEAIQKSDYPPHKQLIKNYVVKSIPELRVLVQQHKIAVTVEMLQHGTLSYQSWIDKISSKDYMMMKQPMYWEHTVVMASKTWPFMEQLNRIVFMQQESGIRYYWEYLAAARIMDYDIQRNIEENGKTKQGREPIKLSVEHILGAIYLLFIGNVVASIFFFVELLFSYHNKN